jgi:tRNA (guanine37-N1)-methyltransferase
MLIILNIKYIEINKNKAQETIQDLKEKELYNSKYKILRDDEFVLIPINENNDLNSDNYNLVEKEGFEQKQKQKKFKDILFDKNIPSNIIKDINSAYDIVGDIIIIGVEDSTKEYFSEIGKSLIKLHPHVKTVLRKTGEHHGVFRTQDMEHIYGVNKKETIIKENNCKIKIDVEKVFCSTRLSFERTRIVELVKESEKVAVFFAGAGPFALAIAKNKYPNEVIGIELNELAVKYFDENIKLNKLEGQIKAICGDVKEVSKDYKDYFNRIVMPLPKAADLFLEDAIYSIVNNGIIHIYRFVNKDNPYEEINNILNKKAEENKVKLEIINKRIIRSYSPSIVEIVLDIKVKK